MTAIQEKQLVDSAREIARQLSLIVALLKQIAQQQPTK